VLDALGRVRQVFEQQERLAALCHRFHIGRSRAASLTRPLPVRHGRPGEASLGVVMRELLDLLAEQIPGGRPPRVDGHRPHRLERLGHRAMEESSAGQEQPAIGDLPDPIMGEVQLVPHRLEHVLTHHLLDRLRRVALFHPAGRLQQGKVELASDDRRHRRHLPTARTEAVEPPGDEETDARRQGQGAGLIGSAVREAIAVEGTDRLHGNKGIAFAHGPDLLLHVGGGGGVLAAASQRTHEQSSVGSRKGREGHHCGVGPG
jgi:hypothetical protein